MTNYVIYETDSHEHNASSKARLDVAAIAERHGWTKLPVERMYPDKKFAAFKPVIKDWIRVARTVKPGDALLIQYPLDTYLNVSLAVAPIVAKLHHDGVKIIYLIHDLDSLRGREKRFEKAFLPLGDVIIAHNDQMQAWIQQENYPAKVLSLDIFDYLVPTQYEIHQPGHGIDIAGNLNHKKAGYIYQLAQIEPNADLNLYGPNFDARSPASKWYKGEFTPEELLSHLEGLFGLVWDGSSLSMGENTYGSYLRYNNPHKLSLYLAANKPVLIWNNAAEASFVREHGCGLTIDSIDDGLRQMQQLRSSDIERLLHNAAAVGSQLRAGHYTTVALDEALEILQ